jgi:hypothetical protein
MPRLVLRELGYKSGILSEDAYTNINAFRREIITIQAGQCGNNGMLLSSADFDRNHPNTTTASIPNSNAAGYSLS